MEIAVEFQSVPEKKEEKYCSECLKPQEANNFRETTHFFLIFENLKTTNWGRGSELSQPEVLAEGNS
jgi:hypothetical protein